MANSKILQQNIFMLLILKIFLQCISPCSIQVCLTWEAQRENITFRCKVNHLTWQVIIYNPLNEEQGHCVNPLPNSECYPMHDNTMFQERRTNTTILILKNNKHRNVTGSWKCYHGTNRDKAIVIVTDLKQESFKIVSENGNCFEEHLAWTFIGVAICVIAILLFRKFVHVYKEKLGKFKCSTRGKSIGFTYNKDKLVSFQERIPCKREDMCGKRCLFSSSCCYEIVKLSTGIALILFAIFIPLAIGKLQNNCKDKKYFLVFGFSIVVMFVVCRSIPRKRKIQESLVDNEEPVLHFKAGNSHVSLESLVNNEEPVIHFKAGNSHVSLELQGEQNDTANNEALLGKETAEEQLTDNT